MRRPEVSTRPVAPAVVAQRLCDLLLSFPSAAVGGVQWQTLARKYEERHASRLDLAQLGHTSPLAAATALLWDVLRLVDAEDTDNPVVAVEDAVALGPRAGSLGTWPSLYQTLCSIVLSHGTMEHAPDADRSRTAAPGPVAHALLLSQLKPLLQLHWHANFDESGLGYLSDEGTFVRLKKMKHLVQAVLRWREQRVSWRAAGTTKATAVDAAVAPTLQLLASNKHNDLVLRLVHVEAHSVPPQAAATARRVVQEQHFEARVQVSISCEGTHLPAAACEPLPDLAQEMAQLRAENAALRNRNEALQLQQAELLHTPPKPSALHLDREIFDDPFEPPPEIRSQNCFWLPHASPAGSTAVPSEFGGYLSGSATPVSGVFGGFEMPSRVWHCGSSGHSGSGTPASGSLASSWEAGMSGPGTPIPAAFSSGHLDFPSGPPTPGVCAYVPVWFSAGNFALMTMGDRGVIPNGIVQQARAFFEQAPVAAGGGHGPPQYARP